MQARFRKRVALTLVETLIVFAIIAIAISFMVVATVRARAAALRLESSNNLKEIVLAVHHYSQARHGGLPEVGPMPRTSGTYHLPLEVTKPSLFILILPYLGDENWRERIKREGMVPISAFLSPADPTVPHALMKRAPVSSYAANALAFSNKPNLPHSFHDGTSNTIAFAEHYAFGCQGFSFEYCGLLPSPTFRRATFADIDDILLSTLGTPPTTEPSIPNVTFQVAPTIGECKAFLPQTPHQAMLSAFADGSVRDIAPGISSHVFWGAVTPRGGEIVNFDP